MANMHKPRFEVKKNNPLIQSSPHSLNSDKSQSNPDNQQTKFPQSARISNFNSTQKNPDSFNYNSVNNIESNISSNDSTQKYQQSFIQTHKDVVQCPKDLFATTHNSFPVSKALHKISGMEFGIILSCLGSPQTEMPLVDCTNVTVVRCKKCRAYINPYGLFKTSQTWVCNFCSTKNQVPSHYKSSLDENGMRSDRFEKPELHSCFYEFIATSEYFYADRVPQTPTFFFLIDVSLEAVNTGLLEAISQSVPQILRELSTESRAKIAVLTFNDGIQHYEISTDGSPPKMTISADLENLVLPPSHKMVMRLGEYVEGLCSFFEGITRIHSLNAEVNSSLSHALKTAKDIIGSTGGKILLFAATPPSIGKGSLKDKKFSDPINSPKKGGTFAKAEKLFLLDETGFYKETATELNESFISVDVFHFATGSPPSPAGVFGEICRVTGGLYHSIPTGHTKTAEKVGGLLRKRLQQPMAWDAVMRVRSNAKLFRKDFTGSFEMKKNNLISFPIAGPQQTVSMSFMFAEDEENPIIFGGFVFFQSAMLYTSNKGERKIRVFNAALPTVNSVKKFVGSIDISIYNAFVAKIAAEKALKNDFAVARTYIQSSCISVCRRLANSHPSSTRSADELPATVRYAALLALGLLKCQAFCEAPCAVESMPLEEEARLAIAPHSRMHSLSFVRSASFEELRLFACPLVFPLLDVLLNDDFSAENIGNVVMENCIAADSVALASFDILVLCDSQQLLVRVKANADSEILFALFGIYSLEAEQHLSLSPTSVIERNAELGERLEILLDFLQSKCLQSWLVADVFVESPHSDRIVASFLYEERTEAVMSLSEFLKFIVRAINTSY